MSHIYMKFEFGRDEEKAQEARHKLDVWRQAFRLDKKVQYKLDREEIGSSEVAEKTEEPEKATKAAKTEKPAAAEKSKGKEKHKESAGAREKEPAAGNAKVSLLVRLYFSSHEKLSEQRWIDRIPTEEPFKSASPKIIHKDDAEFEGVDQEFESREKAENRNTATRA
jgi:hypothetical protein